MLNKYAVEFDGDQVIVFDAKDIEDLCHEISEYFGFQTNLYDICIRGCKNDEEYILVTNEWADNHYVVEAKITKIYLISTLVWKER